MQKRISFRPVEFEEDLERLHQWHHEPHVIPFWKLNIPLDRYRKHLKSFLADSHQDLHIGMLEGIPMSYWETYWAKDDVLGKHYDWHPADQGVHLLIGPPSYLGKGYALPLLQTITRWLFRHDATQKAVAEPDIRNEKMIHIFEKCGFRFQHEIELPDKRAALMFCHREPFIENWTEGVGSIDV
ncbi:GNAT family N-acetyltransferase [Paludifilum halophilum]|uniref:GNAT family N-acetyltransferase n=1 Tax=Paludifilum halophilum TaxID=1642702 RepID=UPI00197F03E4|nr:GNAT family N-acetyltransferase [Paludifilum halophilum]